MKFKLFVQDGEYVGMLNGHIFTSSSLTTEQVKVLVGNPTEEEIIEIFNPKIAEVKENNRKLQELQDVLLESGLFEEREGSYYRKGNPISVPKMLLEKYKELLNKEEDKTTQENELELATNGIEALDNFWLKCSLNPVVTARESLFEFLQTWGFTITSKGYIVGYRNVDVKQESNKELHDFIATSYTKIRGQKKAPKNYLVINGIDSDEYYLENVERTAKVAGICVGNLQELYDNLSYLSDTVYTDSYTGKMTIQIGEVVSIPKEDCDFSQTKCSKGLHVGGTSWLSKGYFGTQGIVVLVNPMHVISCPNAAAYGKMRCSEYLPIGLAEYDDNGKIIPVATDVYEDDYDTYTLEELNKLLKDIDPSNQVIHKLEFQELGNKVYTTLDEYRQILESKNVDIYAEDDKFGDFGIDVYDYFDEEE